MLLTDSKVVSFIQSSLERGNSKADIEQALLKKGWSAQQVQEAISEAQNISQTKSVSVKKSSNKIIVISIIVAVLLLISVGALLFLSGGCSKSSDCDKGYECTSGECVEITAECSKNSDCRDGFECSSGSCIQSVGCLSDSDCDSGENCKSGDCVTSSTAECVSDSDCDSGYNCKSGVCEKSATGTTGTTGSNATKTYVNYKINSLIYKSMLRAEYYESLYFGVNVTNSGDADTSITSIASCGLSNNATSEVIKYNISVSPIDASDDEILACMFNMSYYATLMQTKSPILVTLNVTLDILDNIKNESNENDNSKIAEYTLFRGNLSLPTVSCSSNSGCVSSLGTGYDCNTTSNYCMNGTFTIASTSSVCTADTDCTTGYSCDLTTTSSTYGTCIKKVEDCDDTIDNDDDSLIDCLDIDCDKTGICEYEKELDCDDTYDNDGDELVDDLDTDDCVSTSSTSTIECVDEIDNDGDGNIDYRSGCDTDEDGIINYVCGTYLNDDQNHPTGYTSYGTITSGACDESWYNLEDNSYFDKTVLCGVDEDLDGVVINKDDGCSGALDISEVLSVECSVSADCSSGYECVDYICEAPAEICDDDIDNDLDDDVDCDDSDCSEDNACVVECVADSGCGDYQICKDNSCIDIAAEITCKSDSDEDSPATNGYLTSGIGTIYYWYDYCVDNSNDILLFEGVCNSNKAIISSVVKRKVYNGESCGGYESAGYSESSLETGAYGLGMYKISDGDDSDGGDVPFEYGLIDFNLLDDLVDTCYDENYLLEYSIENSLLYQKVYNCYYGCEEGACCVDSVCGNVNGYRCNDEVDNDEDGGIDYYGLCTFYASSIYPNVNCYDLFSASDKYDFESYTIGDDDYLGVCESLCDELASKYTIDTHTFYPNDENCDSETDNAEREMKTINAFAPETEKWFVKFINFILFSEPYTFFTDKISSI